jgi:2,3-bisphosphoglycerate-independent phosphoglycerate mutase
MRQLTSLLSNKQLPARTKPNPENGLPVLHITLASFVRYSTCFDNPVLLEKELVTQTLLDILDAHKIQTFTIAESEKYAHVTYFFGGGREIQRPHETRILVPSPQTDRCDKIPCMSAPAITQAVLDSLEQAPCDFYLVNYANSDMVGHTGNFEATVKAIQCLDTQLARLFKAIVQEREGTLLITADHGNAEEKWDVLHHQVKTSHTTNPVPFIAVSNNASGNKISCEKLHELSQIAPFILSLLNLPIPPEMRK